MLKKLLFGLLLVVSCSTTLHGFLGFGGGTPQDYVPYFTEKIVDDITLDQAQRLLPVIKTFIDEHKKAKKEWDSRIISIIQSDTIENESSPDLTYRNTIINRIDRAKANLDALQVQIEYYQKATAPQEDETLDKDDDQEDAPFDENDDQDSLDQTPEELQETESEEKEEAKSIEKALI